MQFEPKSDEELYKLLEEGNYDFEVATATEKTSKSSGKEMIELVVKVFGQDSEVTIKDYLTCDGAKLKKFCQATNLEDKYASGQLSSMDCEGRGGVCKVTIEKNEEFGTKNRIAYYVVPKAKPGGNTTTELQTESVRGVTRQQQKTAKEQNSKTSDVPF